MLDAFCTTYSKGGGKWDSWVQGRWKMGQLGTRAVENETAGYKGVGKWDSWVQGQWKMGQLGTRAVENGTAGYKHHMESTMPITKHFFSLVVIGF